MSSIVPPFVECPFSLGDLPFRCEFTLISPAQRSRPESVGSGISSAQPVLPSTPLSKLTDLHLGLLVDVCRPFHLVYCIFKISAFCFPSLSLFVLHSERSYHSKCCLMYVGLPVPMSTFFTYRSSVWPFSSAPALFSTVYFPLTISILSFDFNHF